MLIEFTLSNWKSYRDSATLSMVATREQQYRDRITRVSASRISLLPIAAVFGGNAAGKSNFFQALAFCKWFITHSTRSPNAQIPVDKYRFDTKDLNRSSSFDFDLLIDNNRWRYSFELTANRVLKESLERTTDLRRKISYTRTYNADDDCYEMKYGAGLTKDAALFDLIARTTRPNQLFLTTTVYQNISTFMPVFKWFDLILQLISPNDSFARVDLYADNEWASFDQFNSMLAQFKTGIARMHLRKIDIAQIPIPTAELIRQAQDIPDDVTVRIKINGRISPYVLTKQNGELIAEELVAIHKLKDSEEEIALKLDAESDGTQRIINLLPALINLETNDEGRVYFIDELDRCLHSNTTRKFIQFFLEATRRKENGKSQLLFTTHDLQLMTQDLFRRDEIWFVCRNMEKETSSLERCYEKLPARKDKTLLAHYLKEIFDEV